MDNLNRRDLLRGAALAGLGVAALSSSEAAEALDTVRVGFVGTGARGTDLLRILAGMEGVKIVALCDTNEANLRRAQDLVEKAGQPRPQGETDWRRMCDRIDVDLVITATPSQWHTPICVAAMKAGKHAATEVPAAQTVEECWELVETAEKTGKQCAILETSCYDRASLMILNMIHDGLLGEPLYAEGYRALGPFSWWFDINRGDSLSYLVSMSSKKRDVNVTMIYTEMGRTITLYHDTNTPRPAEHLVRIQGSKGVFNSMMDRIFVDGRSNAAHSNRADWRATHEWEDTAEYRKEFDHKLWRDQPANSRDRIAMYRLIKNLRDGLPLDIDVYDAAAWSVIVSLTEASVGARSTPLDIPDFTREKWKTRRPIDPDNLV
jgi:hypothetical protein